VEDKSQKEVCKIFKCSRRSLMRWVEKYKKDGKINKDNHLLYAVPYQHFTNSIENYFSMLKSRLQKLDGLTHAELKENITKTIRNISKEKYRNIIKGAYERPDKYISKKNNTRKIKKNYL
jgi:transposase